MGSTAKTSTASTPHIISIKTAGYVRVLRKRSYSAL